MFCRKTESDFLLSHIDKSKTVLEYGSGESTVEIARLCKSIVSVEHNLSFYDKILLTLPENALLIYKKPNLPFTNREDGSFKQFRDYVLSPIKYTPFDIIFIDGRARVACTSICHKLSHKDTLVFIHDFERPEYQIALNYLNLIEQVDRMAKFTVK